MFIFFDAAIFTQKTAGFFPLTVAFGMAIPIAFGRNGHLVCPRAVDATAVLGAPLTFQFKGKETMTEDERVDFPHAAFCKTSWS